MAFPKSGQAISSTQAKPLRHALARNPGGTDPRLRLAATGRRVPRHLRGRCNAHREGSHGRLESIAGVGNGHLGYGGARCPNLKPAPFGEEVLGFLEGPRATGVLSRRSGRAAFRGRSRSSNRALALRQKNITYWTRSLSSRWNWSIGALLLLLEISLVALLGNTGTSPSRRDGV